MPTTRFCALFGIPERTYRRWQTRARAGHPAKGRWPRPARSSHRDVVVELATAHPAWGHRKVWAMARHAGHPVTASTVLRILDDEGLLLKAHYQRRAPGDEVSRSKSACPSRPRASAHMRRGC